MRLSRPLAASVLAAALAATSGVAAASASPTAPQPTSHALADHQRASGNSDRRDDLPYDSPRASTTVAPAPFGLQRDAATTSANRLEIVVATPTGVSSTAVKSEITAADVSSLVGDVSSYWSAQTGGKVTFAVDKLAYLPAGGACDSDDALTDLWSRGSEQLYGQDWWNSATAGPTSRQHLVVLYPYASGDADGSTTCGDGTLGLGTVPAKASVAGAGLTFALFGGPNGRSSSQYYAARQTLAHELGHNFGLEHSGTAWCTGSHTDGSFTSSSCGTLSYEDPFDVMGGGFNTHGITPLSTPQKARLGITTGQHAVTPISTTNKYTLTRVGSGGNQAITVVDPSSHERYYVEYRSGSSTVQYPSGVVPSSFPITSYTGSTIGKISYGYGVRILRLAPASADDTSPWAYSDEQTIVPINASGSTTTRTANLPTGHSFTTRTGQVHVAVSGTSTVTVSFTAVKPHVSLSRTLTRQAYAGTPVKVTATLAKTDGYVPSGTVRFKDGSTTLRTVTVSSSGKASYTLPKSLHVGQHTINANFTPSTTSRTRNMASTSTHTTVTVAKAHASVSAKLAHSTVRKHTAPKVAVKISAKGISKPTGTVRIYVHGHKVKTVKVSSARHGKVTVTLPRTTKDGTFSVVVKYSGSSTVSSATSKSVKLHVK